jgi:O-acetyl-ADP-ribose deacetylase (regulator of RNase III)
MFMCTDWYFSRQFFCTGGQEIQEECNRLMSSRGKLSDGEVVESKPGRLPCKAIFHAVGPMYSNGKNGEAETLQRTITNCMALAAKKGFTSISLPAISSGIFRYPPADATREIVQAVKLFIGRRQPCPVHEIYLCVIDPNMQEHFDAALRSCFPGVVSAEQRLVDFGTPRSYTPGRGKQCCLNYPLYCERTQIYFYSNARG